MSQSIQDAAVRAFENPSVRNTIIDLAQRASIEINVQDVAHLSASREYLPEGTQVYISFLPKQAWQDTLNACRAVRANGFEPVPHVPARLIPDFATLDGFLRDAGAAGVRRALLIAGDAPQPSGPFASTSDVLRSGLLTKYGFTHVSVAGHPEGHPKVSLEEVRRAEQEKPALANQAGLNVALVTQFFFESAPFLQWVKDLRARGVSARIVGGLAGPASLMTLFKFAMRCGVGPSMRALGARPSSLTKLVGERGPEAVVRGLAEARSAGAADFDGIHFFCFGGYLRTCQWLHTVANGRFELNDSGGFDLRR
jgi:methylenetetrahydrofolate reductase (NADPH)